MAILAVIASGVFAFFGGIWIAVQIHDRCEDHWTDKQIDFASATAFSVLIGLPAYTMAGFGMVSVTASVVLHLGCCVLYAVTVLAGIQNYTEGFVQSLIFCILISLLLPAVSMAWQKWNRNADAAVPQSPNNARSSAEFGNDQD